MNGKFASTVFLMLSAAAHSMFAQPITHQDDLNLDAVPDRVEIESVENQDGSWTRKVTVVDGATDQEVYVISAPSASSYGFGADAGIGADWTGDGIAEIYITDPLVKRWGGSGIVTIFDGVTFERVHQVEGTISMSGWSGFHITRAHLGSIRSRPRILSWCFKGPMSTATAWSTCSISLNSST